MAVEEGLESTHKQALAIVATAALLGAGLLLVGGDQWFQVALIGYTAVATTVVVYRDLLRRVWFKVFLAAMVLLHLGFVLVFPEDLDRSEFKLLLIADVVGVLGLACALNKLMSRRP